jgi:hypothetical protein
MTERAQWALDVRAKVLKVFNSDAGKGVIEYLEWFSGNGFPSYDNVNFTFTKIGQQQMVSHIKDILEKAKNEKG